MVIMKKIFYIQMILQYKSNLQIVIITVIFIITVTIILKSIVLLIVL